MKGNEKHTLRAELAGMSRRGRGHRYPPELRARVIAYAAALHRHGVTPKEIGDELGMDWRTLTRWLAEERDPGFAQVVVHDDGHKAAVRVVVHGPGGLRIEGLDLDALTELLRKLK
jgi:transposase